MADDDAVLKALQECQQTLSQLKAGHHLADEAEDAFGRLADKVDTVLEERRVRPDRRSIVRAGADRRRHDNRP